MTMLNTKEKHAWLLQLKVGDKVAICNWHYAPRILTVTAITPTQIVCGSDRYRKADGYRVGANRYSQSPIEPVTDEILDKIKRNAYEYRFSRLKPENLSLDQLERIFAIADEAAP